MGAKGLGGYGFLRKELMRKEEEDLRITWANSFPYSIQLKPHAITLKRLTDYYFW